VHVVFAPGTAQPLAVAVLRPFVQHPEDAQVIPKLHGRPRQRQCCLPFKLARGPERLVAPRVALVVQRVLSASRVTPAGAMQVPLACAECCDIYFLSLSCVLFAFV